MSKQPVLPVYPDVLGFLTGGRRLNLDLLQVAVAARPGVINAGKPFDTIVLLQNQTAGEVDAVLHVIVPEKDLAGKLGRFTTPVQKAVRIGLRAGEVGYANLPVLIGHQAAPGEGYNVQIDVAVELKGRGANRVRPPEGGTGFSLDDVEKERHPIIEAISGLKFSAEPFNLGTHRAVVNVPFQVLQATIAGLPSELRPGYVTLWTDADYRDAAWLAREAKHLTDPLLPNLNRRNVFFPLLRYTQERFEAAGYRLWAGEAVLVAKLLTLVLEMGAPLTVAGQDKPSYPRWFSKVCRVLLRRPSLANQVPELVTEHIYGELLYDASMLGFTMLGTVTSEDFGTEDEMIAYVTRLQTAVTERLMPLDLSRVWLPLVLGGLVANTRVVMQGENTKETAHLMLRARERRSQMMDDTNNFLFTMADDLLERAIELF